MLVILRLLWDMCTLKVTPQALPYDKTLCSALIIMDVILGMINLSLQQPWITALWQSILLMIVSIAFIVAILQIKGLLARFIQTTSALIGVGVLLSLLILPVLLIQFYVIQPMGLTTFTSMVSLVFLSFVVLVNIWMLVVTVYIFRHALDVHLLGALLVTLAYIGVHVIVYKTIIA